MKIQLEHVIIVALMLTLTAFVIGAKNRQKPEPTAATVSLSPVLTLDVTSYHTLDLSEKSKV